MTGRLGGRNEADGRSHRRVEDGSVFPVETFDAAMKPMAEATGEEVA